MKRCSDMDILTLDMVIHGEVRDLLIDFER